MTISKIVILDHSNLVRVFF